MSSLGLPDDPEVVDHVLVAGKCYPAHLLHAAMHTVFLEHLARRVPLNSSPRRIALVLRDMKTKQAHKAVMGEALRRVADSGEDVPLAQAIQEGKGLPIAAFPAALIDSRSNP